MYSQNENCRRGPWTERAGTEPLDGEMPRARSLLGGAMPRARTPCAVPGRRRGGPLGGAQSPAARGPLSGPRPRVRRPLGGTMAWAARRLLARLKKLNLYSAKNERELKKQAQTKKIGAKAIWD